MTTAGGERTGWRGKTGKQEERVVPECRPKGWKEGRKEACSLGGLRRLRPPSAMQVGQDKEGSLGREADALLFW